MPSDRSVRPKSKGGALHSEHNRAALDEVIDQRTDSAEHSSASGSIRCGMCTLIEASSQLADRGVCNHGPDAGPNQKPIPHRVAPPGNLPDVRHWQVLKLTIH